MSSPYEGDIFLARRGAISRAKKRLLARQPSRRAKVSGGLTGQREAEEREKKRALVESAVKSIRPVFQPIVDLKTGEAVGVEALSRFALEPQRSPDQWFAEAAEVGLGTQVELAALIAALENLPRLPPGLYMSLNASPDTMMSADFRSTIADVTAERIVLEVTEHSEIGDYATFGDSMADIRANGVRLAVDDAGAGFASFLHILNIQPDIIKLDVALTRGIDSDPARQALGSALLTFGLDAFDAGVVAEGIENERELMTLRALGYPFGQGYHLGRPAPVPQVRLHVHEPELLGAGAVAVAEAVAGEVAGAGSGAGSGDGSKAGSGDGSKAGSESSAGELRVAELNRRLEAVRAEAWRANAKGHLRTNGHVLTNGHLVTHARSSPGGNENGRAEGHPDRCDAGHDAEVARRP
jgi:EAL domain-containing protein (putative c-di-GMP-specific phosphodiesterase class I)